MTQPGTTNQTFTVNQTGNTTIALKNDNTVVTPGNGALTIKTAGENASGTGSFTANQSAASTITLPTIRYGDLSGRPSIPAAANNGTITITQPGTTNQTFTVNQSGNTTIALKNDNTTYTVGNGALTIKTAGQGASATGTFTANQTGASTLTLPTIRYQDISGRPTIPSGDFLRIDATAPAQTRTSPNAVTFYGAFGVGPSTNQLRLTPQAIRCFNTAERLRTIRSDTTTEQALMSAHLTSRKMLTKLSTSIGLAKPVAAMPTSKGCSLSLTCRIVGTFLAVR